MKKAISVLLSILIVSSSLFMADFSSFAATDGIKEYNYDDLSTHLFGTAYTLSCFDEPEDVAWLKFTPQYDATYTLTTEVNKITVPIASKCELYTEDKETCLDSFTGYYDGTTSSVPNATVSFALQKDKTYYYKVSYANTFYNSCGKNINITFESTASDLISDNSNITAYIHNSDNYFYGVDNYSVADIISNLKMFVTYANGINSSWDATTNPIAKLNGCDILINTSNCSNSLGTHNVVIHYMGHETTVTYTVVSYSYVKADGKTGSVSSYDELPSNSANATINNNDGTHSLVSYSWATTPNENDEFVEIGAVISTENCTYGEWASNNNGTHSRTCSVCKDVETENCNFEKSVDENTGLVTYTCKDCGYSYTDGISDGGYKIVSALNENYCVNIDTDNSSNGAKLKLAKKTDVSSPDFRISYNKNTKTYTITSDYKGKVLDVPGASKDKGTKVQQYSSNGSTAQQWILEDAGDGYYYIVSKCNGLYLDIPSAKIENGKEMQLYTGNKSIAQKFKLEKVNDLTCDDLVPSGEYKVSSAVNSNFSFKIGGGNASNGAKLQLGNTSDAYFENFEFKYNEDLKTYTITNSATGKVLDVPGGRKGLKTAVQQYSGNGSKAQQWVLEDAGNGSYYIVSVCNGLYLDIPSGNVSNNANMWLYAGNKSNAQKFKIEEVQDLQCEDIISTNKTYTISSKLNSSKVLDIASASTANKANLQVYSSNGSNAQKFKFIYDSKEKAYSIVSVNSGKALDVSGAGMTNGSNVQQYTLNGSLAQRWVLKKNADGTYTIYSKCNGLCLDLSGGKTDNKTNVQTYESNGSNAQKFNLKVV